MPKEAGDVLYTNSIIVTYESDGALADGAAVRVSGDTASDADTEVGDLTGVATHGADDTASGDSLGVLVDGVIAAQVASGVAQGDDLNAGNATGGSTGQLITESGGPCHALSDEGGTFQGATLAAGVAAVKVK